MSDPVADLGILRRGGGGGVWAGILRGGGGGGIGPGGVALTALQSQSYVGMPKFGPSLLGLDLHSLGVALSVECQFLMDLASLEHLHSHHSVVPNDG